MRCTSIPTLRVPSCPRMISCIHHVCLMCPPLALAAVCFRCPPSHIRGALQSPPHFFSFSLSVAVASADPVSQPDPGGKDTATPPRRHFVVTGRCRLRGTRLGCGGFALTVKSHFGINDESFVCRLFGGESTCKLPICHRSSTSSRAQQENTQISSLTSSLSSSLISLEWSF